MERVVLIDKDQSNTDLYLVQHDNEMFILTACCDSQLARTSSGFYCTMCVTMLHGPTTYDHHIDLNKYDGQFGPDMKSSQRNWGAWLYTWFQLEEGSIELIWPSE